MIAMGLGARGKRTDVAHYDVRASGCHERDGERVGLCKCWDVRILFHLFARATMPFRNMAKAISHLAAAA